MIASWTICPHFQRYHNRVRSHGRNLATWPGFDSSDLPTLCFQEDDGFWILRADQGGIHFTRPERNLRLYPKEGIDAEQFKRLVFHDWLPFVYNFWGLQVLHASAVVHSPSGQVVAFSGASGAGKSTFGYGLGCLPEWQQIADDSLAFDVQQDSVRLLPIPNEVLLRPASSRHYGDRGARDEFLDWTDSPPHLKQVFLLEPSDDLAVPVRRLPVSRGRAYVSLLQQAYTLTLDVDSQPARLVNRPKDNRQQIEKYLSLASQVSVSRLQYPRKFVALDEAFSLIENDLSGKSE